MADPALFGAIELGGTKVNVAIGRADGTVVARERIATADPETTLAAVRRFFTARPPTRALGVGAFGPVILDPAAPDHGHIAATPKPGWSGFDLLGALAPLGVPIALDTDVNAAAIGEHRWGAAAGLDVAIYLTIGTGIGGGLIVDGRPLRGLIHPEMGHLPLRRSEGDDAVSVCPFHTDCAEGLASGPAIARRYGGQPGALPAAHPGHDLVADYIGQLCASLMLAMSPRRIVIGGGVAKSPGLHGAVRARMLAQLGGYIDPARIDEAFVVPPVLGDDAGLLGALAMASMR